MTFRPWPRCAADDPRRNTSRVAGSSSKAPSGHGLVVTGLRCLDVGRAPAASPTALLQPAPRWWCGRGPWPVARAPAR